MIVWNYRKLFSIEFLHDAYREQADVLRSVRIVPDEDTSRLMSDYRLFCRTEQNFFYCYAQTIASIDTSGAEPVIITKEQPLVPFDQTKQLVFRLQADSSQFIHTSNLNSYDFRHNVFGLVNSTGNAAGTALYLSQTAPMYAPNADYKAGMYVTDGTGHIYGAIRGSNNNDRHAPTETSHWRDITASVRFLRQSDMPKDPAGSNGFGVITISLHKDPANEYALLRTSAAPADNDAIIGKSFIAHFKNDAV